MTVCATEAKVEQLLGVLDGDIRHLETTLSQLDTLRRLLIERDDASLDRLLGEIRSRAEAHACNEQARQALRADLARTFGCDGRHLTLSRLQALLPEPQRACIAARQARLKSLIAELNREYTLTAALVSDCSRFNRTLMRALFEPSGQSTVSYSPSGAAKRQMNTSLVSLRL
jgi:hypothetical protein